MPGNTVPGFESLPSRSDSVLSGENISAKSSRQNHLGLLRLRSLKAILRTATSLTMRSISGDLSPI